MDLHPFFFTLVKLSQKTSLQERDDVEDLKRSVILENGMEVTDNDSKTTLRNSEANESEDLSSSIDSVIEADFLESVIDFQ